MKTIKIKLDFNKIAPIIYTIVVVLIGVNLLIGNKLDFLDGFCLALIITHVVDMIGEKRSKKKA